MPHQIYPNPAGGGASGPDLDDAIRDESDVLFTSLTDGNILVYNQSLDKFVNELPTLASDADVLLSNPQTGDILVYNGSLGIWVNQVNTASSISSGSFLFDDGSFSDPTTLFLLDDGTF